jgi:hypothetical protein
VGDGEEAAAAAGKRRIADGGFVPGVEMLVSYVGGGLFQAATWIFFVTGKNWCHPSGRFRSGKLLRGEAELLFNIIGLPSTGLLFFFLREIYGLAQRIGFSRVVLSCLN